MPRSLSLVIVVVASTAALAEERGKPAPAAAAKNEDAFASRLLALTDLVLRRHIDPPTRQQMILEGTRAVYRAAGEPLPQNTSRQISALTTDAELDEFLKGLATRFDKKLKTKDVFLQGLLSSLPGGAHWISGEDLKVQGQLNANRYVGTGIMLRMDDATRRPAIFKPFYNGPAWKAGAKAGDVFLEIDGKSTETMKLQEAVRLLRGERGSVVVVKVRQPNSKDARTLKITRDVAFIPTVVGSREVAPGRWQYRIDFARQIAWVRFDRIGSSTLHELRKVDAGLRGKGVRGIVLDLRDAGGTLHDIVLVADGLLDGGVIGRVRSGDKVTTHNSSRGALFANLPMAVLVSRTTSSGGEFLAAALQDNHRAVIVGEPTPGDGFVRSFVTIPGFDGAVVMAIGELQRGDGTSLRAPWPTLPASVRKLAASATGPKEQPVKRRPGGIIPDFLVTAGKYRWLGPVRASKPYARKMRTLPEDPFLRRAVEVLNARLKEADSRTTKPGKDKG
jgi:carboxyl-terminal processing protease